MTANKTESLEYCKALGRDQVNFCCDTTKILRPPSNPISRRPRFNFLTPRSNFSSPYCQPYNLYNVSSPNWYFSLFSSHIWLILHCRCKEKFSLGHSRELKGQWWSVPHIPVSSSVEAPPRRHSPRSCCSLRFSFWGLGLSCLGRHFIC